MPNWSMKKWDTGRSMTLLEAFGISHEKFHYPQLKPALPQRAAPSPIQVSSGGTQSVVETPGGIPPPKGPVRQYARALLRKYNWGGQYDALNNIIMAESGWNPRIANPSSGAYGIAQALGHGTAATQGTFSDMYGGFGLTDKQAKAANSGDPYWQLVWMLNYIKSVYGDPNTAWAHHQSTGTY